MKKFLLSLAAVCSLSFAAQAETVAFVAQGATYSGSGETVQLPTGNIAGNTYSASGICDFKITKVNSSTSQVNTNLVRWYANDELIITPATGIMINSVTFSCTSTSSNSGQITIGDLSWKPASGSLAYTFNNLDSSEALTFTHSAQNRFAYIEIVYSAGDVTKKPADLSFTEASIVVPNLKNYEFTAPELVNPNELPVTWTSTDPSVATVEDGEVKILAAGKTEITAKSAETEEYNEGEASYTLVVVPAVDRIKDMESVAPNDGDQIYFSNKLYVTYHNGNYTYVEDYMGDQGALLWQINGDNITPGAVIPEGAYLTRKNYNGLVEWTGEIGGITEFKSAPILESSTSVSDADINRIVKLSGVEFTDATPSATNTNFNGTIDGQTYTFCNTFAVPSVDAGKYVVTCAVSYYKPANGDGIIQLLPIKYVEYVERGTEPQFTAETPLTVTYDEDMGEWDVIGETKEDSMTITIVPPTGYNEVYTGLMTPALNPEEDLQLGNTITIAAKEGTDLDIESDGIGYMIIFGNDGDIEIESAVRALFLVKKDTNVGVESINAVEQAAYYTIDGLKISNPEKGLFIKVVNGKATKVRF